MRIMKMIMEKMKNNEYNGKINGIYENNKLIKYD